MLYGVAKLSHQYYDITFADKIIRTLLVGLTAKLQWLQYEIPFSISVKTF